MRLILAPVRVLTIFLSMLVFLIHMSIVWLVVRDRWARLRWSNRLLQYYAKWGLWILQVKISAKGLEHLAIVDNSLLVGNHLGYLDVLVVSSILPSGFVTSKEIQETPFLGQICQMAGCLFVERRNKLNILNEVSDIRDGLQAGLNVAIFPEATSTNGEQVLRFRRPLYVSAIQAQTPIVPFCLNYRRIGDDPVTIETRDDIFWYGDMDFASHLWRMARRGRVEVDIHFLMPIYPSPLSDATLLAAESHAAVEKAFLPIR